MHNLTKNVRMDPAFIYYAAGTTDCESYEFDMAEDGGFEGIACALLIGAVTTAATCDLYCEHSTASGGTFVSIYGSTASFSSTQGSSGVWLISEVYRPHNRYVKFVADRGTANTQIQGGLAFRYRPMELPVAESTTSTGIIDYALSVTGTSS